MGVQSWFTLAAQIKKKKRKTLISCHPTDQNSTEATAPEESVPTQGLIPRMVETFENTDSFPSQVEGAAVQPVKGVRQQVRSGPKKKKDLGTLGKCWVDQNLKLHPRTEKFMGILVVFASLAGYVLAVFMMAIIILLGGGITMGYFYKRSVQPATQCPITVCT